MTKQVTINEDEIPENWSEDAVDLINKVNKKHEININFNYYLYFINKISF
jgi:hypothetical protein